MSWIKTIEQAREHFYGRRMGNQDRPSNFVEGRCIHDVLYYQGNWPSHKQCQRKAIIEGAWCKQHSPEHIQAKRDAQDKKWEQDRAVSRRKFFFSANSEDFYEALKQIAEGHNDARTLAQEALNKAGNLPGGTEE